MKKLLSLLLSFSIVLCVFAGLGFTAEAAEAGTTASNAINMVEGQTYTKRWTNSNCNLNCYNKIVVPSRGVIIFEISKPYDYEGEAGSFDLDLYSSNGTLKWQGTTKGMIDYFSDTYVMKIGVAAGTYILNIDPNFYVYRDSAPIPCTYKYTFEATDFWELEPNNSASEATKIALYATYSGVYCEESYDTNYEDWYRVSLVAGKEYRISIGNYQQLDAGTTLIKMYDPYGNQTDFSFYKPNYSGTVAYKDFLAEKSGEYTLRFYNDGNSAPVEYQVCVAPIQDEPLTTLQNENGEWYYYVNGQKSYETTLCHFADTWFYVENGKVNWNATTLCYYNGDWFFVENGVVNWNARTLCNFANTWFFVENGVVNWNARTLCNFANTWFFVENGMVNWNARTLCNFSNTWFFVENGMVNWNADTLCLYNGDWFHVENGTVNWKETTLCYFADTWFYVENGVVNWNARTLCNFANTWFFVENGMVNWNARTLCNFSNTWFFVENGTVNWNAYTTCEYNGYIFNVAGGVVVF